MKKLLCALGFLLALLPVASQASIIEFNFTGQLVVADPNGNVVLNNGAYHTPIAAQLSYDTDTGIGGSNLSITMPAFLGADATFHDMTMTTQPGTNIIDGNVLLDWVAFGGTTNMPLHIEWDATGLFNAIGFGLQVGDILSGTNLYRDTNGNGVGEAGEFLTDIFSATPYSDTFPDNPSLEGPAPMAATSGSLGLTDASLSTFGFRGYFNIGSGNSMHVTSVSTVPLPTAAWLFSAGLLGLTGMARRR